MITHFIVLVTLNWSNPINPILMTGHSPEVFVRREMVIYEQCDAPMLTSPFVVQLESGDCFVANTDNLLVLVLRLMVPSPKNACAYDCPLAYLPHSLFGKLSVRTVIVAPFMHDVHSAD